MRGSPPRERPGGLSVRPLEDGVQGRAPWAFFMPDPQPNPACIPRLAPGMKFRHDKVREAWVILGPERLFLPDPHAVAVLQLLDGARSLGAIAAELAAQYDAPEAVILADVWEMLQDLAARGAVKL